jgi:hypothetical protein
MVQVSHESHRFSEMYSIPTNIIREMHGDGISHEVRVIKPT